MGVYHCQRSKSRFCFLSWLTGEGARIFLYIERGRKNFAMAVDWVKTVTL